MLNKITPILGLLLFVSCGNSENNIHNYWINSYTVACENAPTEQCLQFQKEEEMLHGEWKDMSSNIAGFEHEQGYLYDLKVREVALSSPKPDGSTVNYELVEIERKIEDPLLAMNSIWVAKTINGEDFKVERDNDLPRIEVNVRANSISGTDGCNFFNGKFVKLTDELMALSPLAQTKKACPNMSYADPFMSALLSADHYNLASDRNSLVLLNGEEEVISFIRAQ